MNESGVEILLAVSFSEFPIPAIVTAAGDKASEHFLELVAAMIVTRKHVRPV